MLRLVESYLKEYNTDPNAAKTWDKYVSKTNSSHGNELGTKIRDGWAELVDLNIIDSEDGTYKKWVNWYRTQTEDETIMTLLGKSTGSHISPEEVLTIYQDLISLHGGEGREVPKGIEIQDNMTEEEAEEQAERFTLALSKAPDEKSKSRIRKGIDWIKKNTGKEARQNRRKARQDKKADKLKASSSNDHAEINKKVEPNGKEADLRNKAREIIESKPKGDQYVIVVYQNLDTAKRMAAQKLRIDKAAVNLEIVGLSSDSGKHICIASDKNLKEGLSRGSLYRRRYHGRY